MPPNHDAPAVEILTPKLYEALRYRIPLMEMKDHQVVLIRDLPASLNPLSRRKYRARSPDHPSGAASQPAELLTETLTVPTLNTLPLQAPTKHRP